MSCSPTHNRIVKQVAKKLQLKNLQSLVETEKRVGIGTRIKDWAKYQLYRKPDIIVDNKTIYDVEVFYIHEGKLNPPLHYEPIGVTDDKVKYVIVVSIPKRLRNKVALIGAHWSNTDD